MIYTVTFNPAIDYVVHMSLPLRPEASTAQRESSSNSAAKGINVSMVLRNLGVENIALGFLAGFTGRAVAQGLAQPACGWILSSCRRAHPHQCKNQGRARDRDQRPGARHSGRRL